MTSANVATELSSPRDRRRDRGEVAGGAESLALDAFRGILNGAASSVLILCFFRSPLSSFSCFMPGRRRDRFSFAAVVVGVCTASRLRARRDSHLSVHPPEVGRPLCVGEMEKEREGEKRCAVCWRSGRTGDLCLLIPATSSESLGAANEISMIWMRVQISTHIPSSYI